MSDKDFKQVSNLMHRALIEGGSPSVHDLLNALRGGGDTEKDPAVFLPPPANYQEGERKHDVQ